MIIVSRWSDVINFETKVIITDELLQEIEVPGTPREVFANKKPIQSSEFFNAGQNSIKAVQCFEIREAEYKKEKSLTYNNERYSIYRTYPKGENIELYCEVRTGGN